jgi:hypothetical protein
MSIRKLITKIEKKTGKTSAHKGLFKEVTLFLPLSDPDKPEKYKGYAQVVKQGKIGGESPYLTKRTVLAILKKGGDKYKMKADSIVIDGIEIKQETIHVGKKDILVYGFASMGWAWEIVENKSDIIAKGGTVLPGGKKPVFLERKKAAGGEAESDDDHEDYLNSYYSDNLSEDQVVDGLIYLTNKSRGEYISEDELRAAYHNRTIGAVLKEYDPISFNVSKRDFAAGGQIKKGTFENRRIIYESEMTGPVKIFLNKKIKGLLDNRLEVQQILIEKRSNGEFVLTNKAKEISGVIKNEDNKYKENLIWDYFNEEFSKKRNKKNAIRIYTLNVEKDEKEVSVKDARINDIYYNEDKAESKGKQYQKEHPHVLVYLNAGQYENALGEVVGDITMKLPVLDDYPKPGKYADGGQPIGSTMLDPKDTSFAKGGDIVPVYLGKKSKKGKSILVIDGLNNEPWANEKFSSKEEAIEFINQNKLHLITEDIADWDGEQTTGGVPVFKSTLKNSKIEPTSENVNKLAKAFAAEIRKDLTAAELKKVIARNKTDEYKGLCATHDFIDSNESMIQAFAESFNRDIQFNSDSDTELINRAWDIAKDNDFNPKSISFADGGQITHPVAKIVDDFESALTEIGIDLEDEDEEIIAGVRGELDELLHDDNPDYDSEDFKNKAIEIGNGLKEYIPNLSSHQNEIAKMIEKFMDSLNGKDGKMARGGSVKKTPEKFYQVAVQYLKGAYGLEPEDIDLDMTVAGKYSKEGENPVEYIDRIAEKYDFDKNEDFTYDQTKALTKSYAVGGETENLEIVNKGQYLTLATQNNKLHIFLTDEGREWVKENGPVTYQNFWELFEDISGNSEFLFFENAANVGIGLTDSPIFTDGYYYDEDSNLQQTDDAKIWWYPDYQVKNPFEELTKEGEVDFDKTGNFEFGGEAGQPLGSTILDPKDTSFAKGGYTIDDGGYSINVHGEKPSDFKIVCKTVFVQGVKTMVCYHETNDKSKKGIEVYVGENYVVGSKERSYSRVYTLDNYPGKYRAIVEELKNEHSRRVQLPKFAEGGPLGSTILDPKDTSFEKGGDTKTSLALLKAPSGKWYFAGFNIPLELAFVPKNQGDDLEKAYRNGFVKSRMFDTADIAISEAKKFNIPSTSIQYELGGESGQPIGSTMLDPKDTSFAKGGKIISDKSAKEIAKYILAKANEANYPMPALQSFLDKGLTSEIISPLHSEITKVNSAAVPNKLYVNYEDKGLLLDYIESSMPGKNNNSYMNQSAIPRIPNNEANVYAENKIAFKANNLEGKTLDNGDYAVLSFGIYPIWYFRQDERKWYGNADKYCQATALHISQSKPVHDATMLPLVELLEKAKGHEANFAFGGSIAAVLFTQPYPNVGVAHGDGIVPK